MQGLAEPSGRGRAPAAGASAPLVLPLAEVGREDLALVGGKAANLGELLRAGLPLPAGFVVTTAAYDRLAAQAGPGPRFPGCSTADPARAPPSGKRWPRSRCRPSSSGRSWRPTGGWARAQSRYV